MEKDLTNLPTRKDLKVIPKDETKDAVIVDLEISTWGEITKDEEKKKKLKNPDDKVLLIKYDVDGLIRRDMLPIRDNPTTSSKYGRFIVKYDTENNPEFKPIVGMKVKVLFDADGNSDILLAK